MTQMGRNLPLFKLFKYCLGNYDEFANFFIETQQLRVQSDSDPEHWVSLLRRTLKLYKSMMILKLSTLSVILDYVRNLESETQHTPCCKPSLQRTVWGVVLYLSSLERMEREERESR